MRWRTKPDLTESKTYAVQEVRVDIDGRRPERLQGPYHGARPARIVVYGHFGAAACSRSHRRAIRGSVVKIETVPAGTGAGYPALASPGDWRLVAVRANGQPAAANYLRAWGESEYRATTLDVLRIADGELVEITTFGARVFPAFGLPAMLAVS